MSKSRSSEDKEREKVRDKEKDREKEKDQEDSEGEGDGEGEGEGERERERERVREGLEDAARQRQINQSQLSGEAEAELKSPTLDVAGAAMISQKEAAIPSSPPPSYEHVLEQTRLEQEAVAQKQEGAELIEGTVWQEKTANGSAPVAEQRTPAKGPEILHKSSKEFYRAMAKQWGITCKMSDHCRCLDCQSHYFDCEYEKNEHQKTDGGLGAGTPMFISEVMHGSGCVLL